MTFDYDTIVQFALSNQFLVGGIGTVVAGAIMYLMRTVPYKIYNWVYRLLTIEINLNNQFPLYEEILQIISKHRLPYISRLYSIDNDQKVVSGFGTSYAFYQGRLMIFHRTQDNGKNYYIENNNITILSRNKKIFESLIAEAKKTEDDPDIIKVHMVSGSRGWGSAIHRSKRTLDSVFIAQEIKDEITTRIKWFLENREWYIQRGINYKLVFMLHGVPGSGKTSLLRALASEFHYRLGVVSSLMEFDDVLRWAPEKAFIVIEDIDALGQLNRDKPAVTDDDDDDNEEWVLNPDHNGEVAFQRVNKPTTAVRAPVQVTKTGTPLDAIMSGLDNKVIHDLLNTLDGLNTKDGSIIFMTTNHLDRLDEALIRPGRLDCCIEIGPLAYPEMARMFESFYGNSNGLSGPEGYAPMTGATLQEIFMRKKQEEAVKVLYGKLSQPVDT